jgi:hypothetical protein
MTASELVLTIESLGGRLTTDGNSLRCDLPADLESMVDILQSLKPAVVDLLQRRATDEVATWLCRYCVAYPEVSAKPEILFREFTRARRNTSIVEYHTFVAFLQASGFLMDDDGMIVGVCLAADWDAERWWERNTNGGSNGIV